VKDYIHFSANDFAMDEHFQSWVWNPDENSNSFWRSWLAAHPQKVDEVEEARYLLQHLTFSRYKLPENDATQLWRRIQGLEHQPVSVNKNKTTGKRLYWAAAAILLVGMTYFLIPQREKRVTYETAFGETKNITLPDQSTIVLNANSKLSFVDNWENSSVREIELEGEAYFSVTHKKNNQPFKVRTDDGVAVEVLGTTFNVYHRTKQTKVVLNSGKISLSLPTVDTNNKIIMKPGELVEFKSNQVSKKSVDPNRYVAWTQKKLVLDHTSLREMVQMMKDNYGVDVEVKPDGLLDQTVSGSMPAVGEEELVKQIAKAFRLTAKQEGRKVVITEDNPLR
jgi:ferric-dicitrate binding protein FerR (iron transport regulator)